MLINGYQQIESLYMLAKLNEYLMIGLLRSKSGQTLSGQETQHYYI